MWDRNEKTLEMNQERRLLLHQLHNQMQVILGRCQLLMESLKHDASSQEHLRQIEEAVVQMDQKVAVACGVRRPVLQQREPALLR